jgi:hypothetical protein
MNNSEKSSLGEGEVIEYLVLKGNYMLSKHEDYEPLPKAIEKVMVFMGVNVLSPEQTIEFPHVEVIGKYIKLPCVLFSTKDTISWSCTLSNCLNIFNIRSKGCDSFEIFEQWLTRYCNSSDLSLSLHFSLISLATQTFKVNCTRKENGHFIPKLLPVLGCKWVCTVWKLISSRYESLASFESVPLIPVRHVVDYISH